MGVHHITNYSGVYCLHPLSLSGRGPAEVTEPFIEVIHSGGRTSLR